MKPEVESPLNRICISYNRKGRRTFAVFLLSFFIRMCQGAVSAVGCRSPPFQYGFYIFKTRYSISFKDGQGESHKLEVSEQLFFEFRQMERRNRNLQQWNQRHREFNEVWDETLYKRALRVPKTLDERMIE